MMNSERIEKLLEEAYFSKYKRKSAQAGYKILKTVTVHDECVMSCCHPFAEVLDMLTGVGVFDEINSDENTAALLVMSGFMNMNPAVVEIRISGGAVYANAHAKEGFLKQYTAEKAIEKVFAALKEHKR